MKKTLFLILTTIGFIVPTYFVILESIETKNYLLYANPMETIDKMFSNRVSTIFSIDLLFGVLVFMIWSYFDSQLIKPKKVCIVWIITLLFGFASGFPLYLYLRELKKPLKIY